MIESVRTGVGGTPMVAWGERLGIDAIEDVVDYIRMTFMGKTEKKISLAKLGEEMAEPMVKGLFGDPKSTEIFFEKRLKKVLTESDLLVVSLLVGWTKTWATKGQESQPALETKRFASL